MIALGKTPTRVVLFGLATYAAAHLAQAFLAENATAGLAVQAIVSEWGAGRLGISWSPVDEPLAKVGDIVRRALRGAGLGLGAAMAILLFAVMTRAVEVHPVAPSVVALVVGLLPPCLVAVRDELLLRGLVLRAFPHLPGRTLLAISALVAAAAAVGGGAHSAVAIVQSALGGVALGALWQRDRGAWVAWGAHAAWGWATEVAGHGALVELVAAPSLWGGDRGIAFGIAATVGLAGVAVAAIAWAEAGRRGADGKFNVR